MDNQPADRQPLAARLKTVQNNYVIGLASLAVLTDPEAAPMLQRHSVRFGTYDVPFRQVADLFADAQRRDESGKAYLIMLMCSLIKDSFELTRHHCRKAGRLPEMRAQAWYHFSRLVRNCIAHNFLFTFKPGDIELLPVRWRDRTITADMNNREMPIAFFGYVQAWEMFMEIRAFAEKSGV